MRADKVLALGPAIDQVVNDAGRAIENGNRVTTAFDVEGQVFAHTARPIRPISARSFFAAGMGAYG